jgi:hypothetical protein
VGFVGGVPYDKAIASKKEVGTLIEPKDLADLIVAEWLDSQSDSGNLWRTSNEALQLGKRDAGEELIKEAYEIAYARVEAMRRNANA